MRSVIVQVSPDFFPLLGTGALRATDLASDEARRARPFFPIEITRRTGDPAYRRVDQGFAVRLRFEPTRLGDGGVSRDGVLIDEDHGLRGEITNAHPEERPLLLVPGRRCQSRLSKVPRPFGSLCGSSGLFTTVRFGVTLCVCLFDRPERRFASASWHGGGGTACWPLDSPDVATGIYRFCRLCIALSVCRRHPSGLSLRRASRSTQQGHYQGGQYPHSHAMAATTARRSPATPHALGHLREAA